MFEILSTLIVQALSKIFGTSVDIVAKDVSFKRSMAAACIELFDSLYKLENASKAAYTIFKEIADGKRVTTKVMIKDKMEDLFRSYEAFVKSLRIVESKFAIYNQDLLIKVRDGVMSGKFGMFKNIDLLLDAAPIQVVEENKLTSSITYLAVVPEEDLFKPIHSMQGNSENELKQLRKSILSKFEKRTVNLELPKEAEIALRSAEENIRNIQQTREQLAEFIKENFPLKDILL
jgi:hypothetical protein